MNKLKQQIGNFQILHYSKIQIFIQTFTNVTFQCFAKIRF